MSEREDAEGRAAERGATGAAERGGSGDAERGATGDAERGAAGAGPRGGGLLRDRRRLVVVAALLAVLVAVAAVVICGGGDDEERPVGGNENADPATVAPANALAYLTFYVRPTGQDAAGADRLLRRVLGAGDPGARLSSLAGRVLAQTGAEIEPGDVTPWLGRRAAVVVVRTPRGFQAAMVIASKDVGRSQDELEEAAEATAAEETELSHRGVDYFAQAGQAAGVVGDFVVLGNEAAFRAVVNASQGASLAERPSYRTSLGPRAARSLGALYADTRAVVRALIRPERLDGDTRQAVETVLGSIRFGPTTGLISPAPRGLELAASVPISGGGVESITTVPATQLAELPRDALAALGISGIGDFVGAAVEQQTGGGLFGGLIRSGVEGRIRETTGLELGNDVITGLGDVVAFERGVRPAQSGSALIIRSDDEAALDAAVPRYADFVSRRRPGSTVSPRTFAGVEGYVVRGGGLSRPVNVLFADGRVIIGSGDAATRAALAQGPGLGTTADFRAARAELRGAPMLFYGAIEPAVARALAALPPTAPSDIRTLGPALRRLGFATLGMRRAGTRLVVRGVLRVR